MAKRLTLDNLMQKVQEQERIYYVRKIQSKKFMGRSKWTPHFERAFPLSKAGAIAAAAKFEGVEVVKKIS